MLSSWQLYLLLLVCSCVSSEDYYEMFKVARDATNLDIRKAFKRLAVTMHPDKNPDDPDADAKFIKVTRAYEVLKDADSRKRYDLYGEESSGATSGHQRNYHSWSYYHDQFGIYDDDLDIITLSHADFDNSVRRSSAIWFVNYYSTQCSHCHHLAPAWRRLAAALRGVVRVGAVNCDEDWVLCRAENVRSYPSLVIYPTGEKYQGDRTEDELTSYVLERLHVSVSQLTSKTWDRSKPWVLFLCDGVCFEDNARILVAAVLAGLVDVGQVECDLDPGLCDQLMPGTAGGAVYHAPGSSPLQLAPGTPTQLANQVLALLPEATPLDENTFKDLEARLESGDTGAWLVHFDLGAGTEEDLEWRRLPALAPKVNVARVHCGRYVALCTRLHVRKYPTFAVLKPGGGYETHHGRTSVYDVADFARDSAGSPNVRSLSHDQFNDLVQGGVGAWFVDFYAPWCPPCLRLLPELRTASRQFHDRVRFGTVDCTVHDALCRQQHVTAYPTTVLFNASVVLRYHGTPQAGAISEFLQDIMQPVVFPLTADNFYETVGSKDPAELWLVDFYAPWCGPCQQLKPEWRDLAKMVSHFSYIHVGSVDCVTEADLCSQQGVRSYPTIRLYPTGGRGLSTVALFSGQQRDASALRKWLFHFLPSPVEQLTADTFLSQVVQGADVWLVDFHVPWCGYCVSFQPEFMSVAMRLGKRVRCGSLNCDLDRASCQRVGVASYPTVRLFNARTRPHGRELTNRMGDSLVRAAEEAAGEGVATVTKERLSTHDEF